MPKPVKPNELKELHNAGETLIWVENNNSVPESNVLITVSDNSGEHTYLVSGEKLVETDAGLFVQTPEERIVVGTRAWYRRVSIGFKWFSYVLASVLITFSVFSFSGAVKARVVLTGSMVPTINPGDIIITVPTTTIAPKVGRIVAYVGRRFDGTAVGVFSHRIIGGNAKILKACMFPVTEARASAVWFVAGSFVSSCTSFDPYCSIVMSTLDCFNLTARCKTVPENASDRKRCLMCGGPFERE